MQKNSPISYIFSSKYRFGAFVHLLTDQVDKAYESNPRMRERKEIFHSITNRLANGAKSNSYLNKQAV